MAQDGGGAPHTLAPHQQVRGVRAAAAKRTTASRRLCRTGSLPRTQPPPSTSASIEIVAARGG